MRDFTDIELKELLENDSPDTASRLAEEADVIRRQ